MKMSRVGYGKRVDLIIGFFFGGGGVVWSPAAVNNDYGVVTDTMDTSDLELLLVLLLLCCILVNNSMIF